MQLTFLQNASVNFTRRHRVTAISLAIIAAGTFLIFMTRSMLEGTKEKFRTCEESTLYEGLSLPDVKRKYHYTMERLMEERMRLYEGSSVLSCGEETMDIVIPPGEFASTVSDALADSSGFTQGFTYRDFEYLLHEFWRTYDCHLFWMSNDLRDPIGLISGTGTIVFKDVERERVQARVTFDRLMTVLRSSEQNLPLHASLRCLQRAAVDVRNAAALIGDAAQCVPARLWSPETSIRK